jgi:putative lipoprotein
MRTVARVTGILRLPPGDRSYGFTRVLLSVRDVTELDGPAPTVATIELPRVDVPDVGADLPFAFEVELDPHRTYVVRVHADRNGSGAVEPGDFVSTTAHAITPAMPPSLVVPLQPVGG